ncbi:MAG: zinc carboxypeptidase [Bacteroidetes bacterium]|nr:zinc carboxypeptidase [Bacteroidota bacterium]
MKKIIFLFFFLPNIIFAQEFKSPAEFLGYRLGEKFTPHYKIVNYFTYAANSVSGKMLLEQYGETYEGRPLLAAIISSEQNIRNIAEIQKNNLRLSGLLNDKPADVNMPTVVWLSYNVHGNEASSSEVAMKMLYELTSGKNSSLNEQLKNVVVIIDPCLNPDGRDRYVNWYNGVTGNNANADVQAREHNEPWPGGRTNHYYFDLNRDWAWQSQQETQARIKLYNKWMPEIHVDFHEQYYYNPYYFAPAAEPMHEAITPFQRSFQIEIGKNHAKYFDANGWLYFTKEYFDLFYPSYGDTYPIFNGAIGMTYEQAGHGMAGLAINNNGDTLKLTDRIAHHFTTGISTIEVASKNYVRLNSEFKKYFDDAVSKGSGEFKTYVIKGTNTKKLLPLKQLLGNNNIKYSYAGKRTSAKGYNYFSKNNENFNIEESDIIINSQQTKAELLRVLFEPQSKLSDSATYDITAWAIPFAFGLNTYGLKENIQSTANYNIADQTVPNDAYAYIIEYNSFEDGKLLASLLKNDFNVRVANGPFTMNGKNFNPGTLIILKSTNRDKIDILLKLALEHKSVITPVNSGFMEKGFDFGSDKVQLLKKPKIAMVVHDQTDENKVGEVWHLFDRQLDYPLTLIDKSFSSIDFNKYDVVILPSGYYSTLSDKNANTDLKSWIKKGGVLIAMDYAVKQLADGEWGIEEKKDDEDSSKDDYSLIKKYADREREAISDYSPGSIYKVQIDNTHPLGYGYPEYYYTLKLNPSLFNFLKDGWNVGYIKKDSRVAGFVGNRLTKKINDILIFGEQPYGRGKIIYLAEDPLFRSFWENGKLIFANAVFFSSN